MRGRFRRLGGTDAFPAAIPPYPNMLKSADRRYWTRAGDLLILVRYFPQRLDKPVARYWLSPPRMGWGHSHEPSRLFVLGKPKDARRSPYDPDEFHYHDWKLLHERTKVDLRGLNRFLDHELADLLMEWTL